MYKAKRSKMRKRKTRKCLDEMRKKSLFLVATGQLITHNAKHAGKSKSLPKNITSDRLTMKLGMFAKGVRSKTITRPMHVSEEFKARMDQDLYKIIDLANGKPSHTTTSGSYENILKQRRSKDWVEGGNVEIIIEDHIENIDQKKRCNDDRLCKLPLTRFSTDCTPPNQVKRLECVLQNKLSDQHNIMESEEEENSIQNSQEPAADCGDEECRQFNEYYRKFIQEQIPAYLCENVTGLMNEETIKHTKTFLQDVFKKHCYADSDSIPESPPRKQNKSSNIIEQAMKESILLNPIEYINQSAKHENSYCDPEISNSNAKCNENLQHIVVPTSNFSVVLPWNGNQYVDSLTWRRSSAYAITEDALEESEEQNELKISLTPEELTQNLNASSVSDGSCDAAGYKEPYLFYCFPRKLNL